MTVTKIQLEYRRRQNLVICHEVKQLRHYLVSSSREPWLLSLKQLQDTESGGKMGGSPTLSSERVVAASTEAPTRVGFVSRKNDPHESLFDCLLDDGEDTCTESEDSDDLVGIRTVHFCTVLSCYFFCY